MRVALDTNILVYAEGVAPLPEDAAKPPEIRSLLSALRVTDVVIPAQVLGELYRVLAGKARWSREAARTALLNWSDSYQVADTTAAAMKAATDLATTHQLSIWDSVVVSVAAETGCRLLLSEDMQDGLTWQGLTVVNPLTTSRHPLLAAFLLH